MKKTTFRMIVFGIILATGLTACGNAGEEEIATPAQPRELLPVMLPVGYIPNIQFAPLYVAVENGHFAEAGFDVSFDYRFETDGVALVGQGALPFAVVSGEQVLLARAQGVPVVYVVSWYQDFPVGVAAKSQSGIEKPEDLIGKRVGLPGLYGANYIGLYALLGAAGINPADLNIDSIGFNQVEALGADQVDAVVVYVTNEPVQLRAQGYEINEFSVAEYVQLTANGLITSQELIESDPEMVHRFVQAFLAGLADAIADPEAAYQISTGYVEGLAEADKDIQMEVLRRSIAYWEADPLGVIHPEAWENMENVLLQMGLLTEPQDVEQAYSTEFIE